MSTKNAAPPLLIPPYLHGSGAWGGHLQSILPSLVCEKPVCAWQRERWMWQDGDFVDADWLHQSNAASPLLILFHGLEGSSDSHYARSIGAYFLNKGWRVCVPHFRGCSGTPNHLLRAYHSGDAAEIERMLTTAHGAFPNAPLYAAGVSLGGNALLCYLAKAASDKQSNDTSIPLRAAAAVCAPLDLARCGQAITTGFANVYTLMFMRSLRAKALEKRARFPHDCDWNAVIRSKNLAQFDDVFTAPVHGYRDAADYYAKASAKAKLQNISLPTLLLNTLNDPFVPRDVLVDLRVSPSIIVEQPINGGHVGFATANGALGAWGMGELTWLPQRLDHWFSEQATRMGEIGNG